MFSYNFWASPCGQSSDQGKARVDQFLDLLFVLQVKSLRFLAHPAKYDGQRPEVRLPPQPLGAQTREILAELGYSGGEIEQLAENRVVHTA